VGFRGRAPGGVTGEETLGGGHNAAVAAATRPRQQTTRDKQMGSIIAYSPRFVAGLNKQYNNMMIQKTRKICLVDTISEKT